MVIRLIEGEELYKDWVPLAQIAPALRQAVVAAEDNRFCDHGGFDWTALGEVLDELRAGGRPRGASTITMQTAKNLFLWPDRSLLRKGLEAWLTPQIELIWDKRRILEVYLNIVEMGPGIYGAQAAASRHFGKSAADLGRLEAIAAGRRPAQSEGVVAGRADRLHPRPCQHDPDADRPARADARLHRRGALGCAGAGMGEEAMQADRQAVRDFLDRSEAAAVEPSGRAGESAVRQSAGRLRAACPARSRAARGARASSSSATRCPSPWCAPTAWSALSIWSCASASAKAR